MKKEIALPVLDPFHLMDICQNAILGAVAMGIKLEFRVTIDGDNLQYIIVAEVTEEEAAELDKFQEFAYASVRQLEAEAAGSTATVN